MLTGEIVFLISESQILQIIKQTTKQTLICHKFEVMIITCWKKLAVFNVFN